MTAPDDPPVPGTADAVVEACLGYINSVATWRQQVAASAEVTADPKQARRDLEAALDTYVDARIVSMLSGDGR